MKKILLAAIGVTMALSFVPGHADPTNVCLATAAPGVPASSGVSLTCHYVAGSTAGQVTVVTPNQVHVVDTTTGSDLYDNDTLTAPTQANYTVDHVGDTVSVTVGPDSPGGPVNGSIGIVVIGDAN